MNKQLKKTLSLILAVIMTVMSLSSVSFAADSTAADEHAEHVTTEYVEIPAEQCKDGYTAGVYCNTCKVWISGHELMPAPHVPSGKWVLPAAIEDCEKSYIRIQFCDVCNVEVYSETITAHGFEITGTDKPYCDVAGTQYMKCKVCKKEVSQPLEAKEHSWGEWSIISTATCTLDGKQTRSCANCIAVDEVVITALNHNYVIVDAGSLPTCTKEGSTARKACSNCGDVIPGQTLSYAGHKDADGDSYCDVCDKYFTADVPEGCDCPCHLKSGFLKVLYDIIMFFLQLFNTSQTCVCGAAHYTVE